MKEGWLLALLSAITILVAIGGYFFIELYKYSGSLYVKNYNVYFSPDGNLTEDYEYVVNGDYRYLYRTWNVPLLYNQDFNEPYIKLLEINGPYIPYVKDYYGKVYASDYQSTIRSEAYRNEVGCFNPDGYEKGTYSIEYNYIIYPPVKHDDEFYHINLKLADEHVPYRSVAILIDNSSGNIVKLYSHPPLPIKKQEDRYMIEGKSQRNGIIELEMVLDSANPKFAYYEDEIMKNVIDTNNAYYFKYKIASISANALKMTVFLFPLVMLIIYYICGRERKFVVPKHLSFIPKKRKPWLVNLVFKRDAMDFDMDGFYATLLDLQRRGFIEIENEKKEIKIKIIKDDGLDKYERKVIHFLKKYSLNDVFSTKIIEEKIEANRGNEYALSKIREDFQKISRVRDGSDFIVNGRKTMLKFFGFSLLIFFIFAIFYAFANEIYPVLLDAFLYSLLLSTQFLLTVFAPSTLFGKWKKEYYKEKMEWDAFKNFLLDMAHLEKYKAEDISIWKEWLIYATALGIGKKILKQFKKLNINIPEADALPYIYIAFASTQHTLSVTYSSSVSSSGGGFGAGGGFGGGGAGGR